MRAKTVSSPSFVDLLFSIPQDTFTRAQDFGRKSFFARSPKLKLPLSPKVLLVVLGIIVFAGVVLLFKSNSNSSAVSSNSSKPAAPVAKQTQEINKEYSFPIKDDSGKELSRIKYVVQTAELQDEILVKGQRAQAVQGRTFLIIDLKISNSFDKGIQINSRDYIRLIINGNKNELIAADIHNDPVEVQAISTKLTRIGFPINDTDKNLELQVGEINGKKESIKLTFK